jgi:hypothetical protein
MMAAGHQRPQEPHGMIFVGKGAVAWSAARDVLRAFEQRARELDGDEAVTGLDALDARYYPPDRGSPPGEQAMMNLRGVIQRLIGPEL